MTVTGAEMPGWIQADSQIHADTGRFSNIFQEVFETVRIHKMVMVCIFSFPSLYVFFFVGVCVCLKTHRKMLA